MESKYQSAKMPDLDGPTAFLLISLLDRLVEELWLLYGDEILRDHDVPGLGADGTDLDPPF